MSWSIKLFKVKGIDIKVHLTFVLILVWAAYSWSKSTGAGWQGALFGVAAILLLFVAVTLHELGHSFQALRYGVRVRDITLMPLGGLAQMEEMPKKPSEDAHRHCRSIGHFGIAALLFGLRLLQVESIAS
jgi:Zn-dependent protease